MVCEISSRHCPSQTIRAGELKFWENVHPPPCVTCHASYVMCHVSGPNQSSFKDNGAILTVYRICILQTTEMGLGCPADCLAPGEDEIWLPTQSHSLLCHTAKSVTQSTVSHSQLCHTVNSVTQPTLSQGQWYPILDTRISVLRHTQGTPPGFWNGLDWRALVESHPPHIGKLRGQHFFSFFGNFFLFLKNVL